MIVYKSKIGLELVIPLSLIFGWTLIMLIIKKEWIGVVSILVIIIIMTYTFFAMNYIVEPENLTIKCTLLCNEKIPIQSIRKISETNNILSSPAYSIDRLEIFYNKFDSIMISPKYKKEFIENLLELNPNIEIVYKKVK